MKKIFVIAMAGMMMACNGNKPGSAGGDDGDSTLVAESEVAKEVTYEYDLEGIAKRIKGFKGTQSFSEGLATAQDANGMLGVIDMKGNVVVPFEYDLSIARYSEGIICLQKESEGKYYFFDREGKLLFTAEGDEMNGETEGVNEFHDGLALRYSHGHYFYINRKGAKVFGSDEWQYAGRFSEGMAPVINQDDLCGFINTKGELVIPYRFDQVGECEIEEPFFQEGVAAVTMPDDEDYFNGYIDKTGKRAIAKTYVTNNPFSEGLALVNYFDEEKNQSLWGYINKKGELVFSLDEGVWGTNFSEGLAQIHDEDKVLGYIDKTGKLVIKFNGEYQDADPFCEGMARVWNGGLHGYIDKTGKLVVPCEYVITYGVTFSCGLAAVMKTDGTEGYVDKNGKSTFDF